MACASAVILCRSEMFIYACLMFAVFIYRREWKILPLIMVGPLIWIGSTTIISGNILTFFREWKHFTDLGKFIPGASLTHYIENLHTTFGIVQTILFAAGVVLVARAKRTGEFAVLYATIAITLIFHTIAGAEIFHWTGSIGELRYIIVVGPLFGIVSCYGLSELFERIASLGMRTAVSILIFGIMVFNCTLTTHPRLWANYNRMVIALTTEMRRDYPHLTVLSNNPIVAYVMDVSPAGGSQYALFNKETFKKFPECLILWDPFSSNSIFYQTELTKEMMLQNPAIQVIKKVNYWSAEYLLLYKHPPGVFN